jgi:hypothetical protein
VVWLSDWLAQIEGWYVAWTGKAKLDDKIRRKRKGKKPRGKILADIRMNSTIAVVFIALTAIIFTENTT